MCFLQEKMPKRSVGIVPRIFFVSIMEGFLINLIFSVLKNERGVRGEFHFLKILILFLMQNVS